MKTVLCIPFSLILMLFNVNAYAIDDSLTQGFRNIPWESKNSVFKSEIFKNHNNIIWLDDFWSIFMYDYDSGTMSLDVNTYINYRSKNTFYYTKKQDNLSLKDKIKFENIYYIIQDDKFIGVIMVVDKNSSGYTEWIKELESMFPDKKFISAGNNYNKHTKIDHYTRIGYSSNVIVIMHTPKEIQDIIDKKSKKKKKYIIEY